MNERSIFIEALERDGPADRAAYLDGACGGDAELRARLDKLFKSYDNAKSFLASPPDALVATIAVGDADAAEEISLDFLDPSEKPGCLGTLDQYEVIDVVGRGGMGIVLRAYDTKLNRVVAIKAIAPQFASNAMAVKRFLRKARAAAAVNHDHVVTIHAIHDSQPTPYLVMEFIEGQSLHEKLMRTGGFSLSEILRIGMQAADGLAAAHEQGIVHRDIKPANVLLENGVDRVKITDFGLARAIDDVSVTQPGMISGTPEYMSPEQARGEAIDHRSDLFSLGGVLYTMCTGRPPFRAATSIAMLRSVLEDAPRSIREINPDIPAWLEEVIARLLAKDPADRFQSSREVAELCRARLANAQGVPQPGVPQPAATGTHRFTVFQANPKAGSRLGAVHLVFALACITLVVGIAGTVTCLIEELEAAYPMLPLLGLLGLVVMAGGWRIARSWGSVAYGMLVGLLAIWLIWLAGSLQFRPTGGDELVFYVAIVSYAVIGVPGGIVVLISVLLEPEDRWPTRFQFTLRHAQIMTVVASLAFFAAHLAYRIGDNIALPCFCGLLVVTIFVVGVVASRIVRKLAARGELVREIPWQRCVLLGTLATLAICFVMLGYFFDLTNVGYVIINSPVETKVERFAKRGIEQVYRVGPGLGVRQRVHVGQWRFRIQDEHAALQLDPSSVRVHRGSVTTLTVLPTEEVVTPVPIVNTDAWDKLVLLAEEQYESARQRKLGGLLHIQDLHRAEAGLIQAKIHRERARKNLPEVVSLLKQLIEVRNKELKVGQAKVAGGKGDDAGFQETIKALLEAQAELDEASATLSQGSDR